MIAAKRRTLNPTPRPRTPRSYPYPLLPHHPGRAYTTSPWWRAPFPTPKCNNATRFKFILPWPARRRCRPLFISRPFPVFRCISLLFMGFLSSFAFRFSLSLVSDWVVSMRCVRPFPSIYLHPFHSTGHDIITPRIIFLILTYVPSHFPSHELRDTNATVLRLFDRINQNHDPCIHNILFCSIIFCLPPLFRI